MSRRRFPLWIVLGVVLVVALVVGSGAFDSTPPTAAQRAAAIERGIKCCHSDGRNYSHSDVSECWRGWKK